MSFKTLAFCLGLVVVIGGCASKGEVVLGRLAQQLAITRSHPWNTAICPEHISSMVGMDEQVILAKLGKPDSVDGPKSTYIFMAKDNGEAGKITHQANGLDSISLLAGTVAVLVVTYSSQSKIAEVQCQFRRI
jgi:hypothetical protein